MDEIVKQASANGRFLAGDCVYANCYTCPLPKCNKTIKEEPKMELSVEERLELELPPVPEKPKEKWMRKDYYDDNKEQIITEIKQNGLKPTLKRWGISQATWAGPVGLNNRWQAGFPWEYTRKRPNDKPVTKNSPPVTKTGVAETNIGENITNYLQKETPPTTTVTNEPKTDIMKLTCFVVAHELPAFPGFDNTWNDPIKLAWFEGYICLIENNRITHRA